ncbi:Radical SAM superfamily protein [uncultured archaeon]|nr:Radical SAM superfamily protein [uncultured archaeon]
MPKVVFFDLFSAPLPYLALKDSLEKNGIEFEIISLAKEVNRGIPMSSSKYTAVSVRRSVYEIERKIERIRPQLSGTTMFGITFYDYELAHRLLVPVSRLIKEKFPEIPLVGGGPAFNSNPRGYYVDGRLDYAFRGEAEKGLPALVRALAAGNREMLGSVPGLIWRRGNELVVPSRPFILPLEEVKKSRFIYTRSKNGRVMTYMERGCPYACLFCSVMRRGKPVPLEDDEIIAGLLHLARDHEIKGVQFTDDNLFYDKERACRLFARIINQGLHKRFKFTSMATVNSFLTEGKDGKMHVDVGFMEFIKKANVTAIRLGTEMLDDNILRELKRAPYTAVQAIKVNDALRSAGIEVGNFMLAGGIETRAVDFLRSYYNATAKNVRHRGFYYPLTMIRGYRDSPLYRKAAREGALLSEWGDAISGPQAVGTEPHYIAPKQAELRTFFARHLAGGKDQFSTQDLEDVAAFAKTVAGHDPGIPPLERKMRKLIGIRKARENDLRARELYLFGRLTHAILDSKGIEFNNANVNRLISDPDFLMKTIPLLNEYAKKHQQLSRNIEKLKGRARLQAIKKLRDTTSFGMHFQRL